MDRAGFGAWPNTTAGGDTLWVTVAQAHLIEKTDPRWTTENGGWIGCRNLIRRSNDGGRTWSAAAELRVEAPPGGFQVLGSGVYELNDGTYAILFEPFFTIPLSSFAHEVALLY